MSSTLYVPTTATGYQELHRRPCYKLVRTTIERVKTMRPIKKPASASVESIFLNFIEVRVIRFLIHSHPNLAAATCSTTA